jgi:hypothetical protein
VVSGTSSVQATTSAAEKAEPPSAEGIYFPSDRALTRLVDVPRDGAFRLAPEIARLSGIV